LWLCSIQLIRPADAGWFFKAICFTRELNNMKQDQFLRPGCRDDVDDFNGRFQGLFREDESARKVDRSIAYMAAHLNEPLQVSTLAALVNVSPSHFFALFKQHTGCPPMDYFTRLRMRHAGELLFSTSASVKEVAAALGYDDPFYFSRVFKSVHNVSPSHYRTARVNLNGLSGPSPVQRSSNSPTGRSTLAPLMV
jgi:transcriptional regulator GlxA family with amidase domain